MNSSARKLFEKSVQEKLDRRRLIKRTGAVGLGAAMLKAGSPAVFAQDASNPLGFDSSKPVDFVMWQAGWGDEFALNAVELFKAAHPGAEVEYEAVQRVMEAVQPRFVSGDPPDLVEAGNLDETTLIANGQILPVTDLLNAPSWDTEGKTVGETLLPATQDSLIFDGVQYGINFTAGMYGMWFSQPLMDEHGWTYPRTWDEMLALCEDILAAGIAPFTYPGQYPGYFTTPFWQLVWKEAGVEPTIAIDNLEPDAWRHESIRNAADALYQLRERGFMMEGSEALSHTESQAEWLQGKAVFIPNGNWLENEMKELIPDGFGMTVAPTPPLSEDGPIPFEGIQTYSGQPFIVPAQGDNNEGGLELLRALVSKENARFFSEYAQALTTIDGAAEGIEGSTAFMSAQEVTQAAGEHLFTPPKYSSWYQVLGDEVTVQMGALVGGQIDPDGFIDAVQQAADAVREDDSIPKFTREG